jgi:RNA polymerase sigma factor (sigma-70 family)
MGDKDALEFSKFLNLLHPDPEEAARKYRKLADDLTAYLERNGHPEAEDLAQEALVRTFRGWRDGRFEPTPDIRRHAFGVARRLADEYSRQRRLSAPVDVVEGPLWGATAHEELRLHLMRALQELAPDERRLLLAYYADETDRTVLASQLHLTPGAIRVKIHRLLRRLREQLPKHRLIDRTERLQRRSESNEDAEVAQALLRLEDLSAALTVFLSDAKAYGEMLDRHRMWAEDFARNVGR